MSNHPRTAHCTLCHADFVPMLSGNGGHACPFKPTSFDDAREILIATFGLGCAKCDTAKNAARDPS